MNKNSELLTELYKLAKQKRVVLNKEEFARALDYSRSHLHRLMSGEESVSDELVERARMIANDTKNVLNDPIVKYVLNEKPGIVKSTVRAIPYDSFMEAPFVPVTAFAGYHK